MTAPVIDIKPAPDAHPAVQFLFAEINAIGLGFRPVERAADIGKDVIRGWRSVSPTVDRLEAALRVLGYRLDVVPVGNVRE